MGLRPCSWPKFTRKFTANGMITNRPKAPPPMNSSEPTITNGAAYLRSCLWRPGATKAHTFHRMTGMAMKIPRIIATFM